MKLDIFFKDGTTKIIENVNVIDVMDYFDSEEPEVNINGKYGDFYCYKKDEIRDIKIYFND